MLQELKDIFAGGGASVSGDTRNHRQESASSSAAPANPIDARIRPVPAVLVMVGLFLVAALVIYQRPLFYGDALYFRDVQIFFAPMKFFLGSALLDGYWPWWNPAIQMGTPFFADPQSGVFYPPSVIFAFFDTPRGIAVSLALHLVIGQFGAYQLARYGGFGRLPSIAAALVYGLGGWSLSSGNMLTLAHSIAWAPWSILVCERLWRLPDRRNIAIAAVILAMQMYSGWPEMFILLAIVLLVRRIFTAGILEWRWLAACLAAGVIAAGLFMPQFLATLEAFNASARVGGLRTDELLEYSATSAQWLSLLQAPVLSADNWNIFAAFSDGHVPIFLSLHIGWLALLFVAIAVLNPCRFSLAWIYIAAIGVFLALGRENPLAVPILELLNPFRTPEKYLFLFHLGISMLVAPGVERLLSWLPLTLTRWSNLIACLLILILAGELIQAGRKIDLLAPASHYDLSMTDEARLIALKPGRIYTRSIAQENTDSVRELYSAFRNSMTPNMGVMAGLSYVGGVSFLAYSENSNVLGLLNTLPPSELLARRLGFFGVRYVVTDDPSFAFHGGWKKHAKQLTPKLWQLNLAAPLLSFSRQVVHGGDQDLSFAASDHNFANGNLAYVSPAHAVTGEKAAGRVLSLHNRPGLYNVEVETSGSGWLVLRENYYPGWTAQIDGQPAEIVRTNRVFMGLSIPPGKHEVTFEFRPTQLNLGLLIAALSFTVLVILFFTNKKRRTKNGNTCKEA